MKTLPFNFARNEKKKSLTLSIAIHTVLLVLGLIPIASQIEFDPDPDSQFVIPIEFAEFAPSQDEGLKAKSPVPDPEPKPVVEEKTEEPDVPAETISEVTQTEESIDAPEVEAVEETMEEVVATDELETGDAPETTSEGGSEATAEEGVTEGSDTSGEDEGQSGLDGNGVITRKITHREDISQAAFESGKIVIDICIDRSGKVLTAKNNADGTDIADMDMVRQALEIAVRYRFEIDYTAAQRECGSLTFIFDINGGLEDSEFIAGMD